jgi:hypothetical protein
MTDLNCPLCGLKVPVTADDGGASLEECPRCLAHSGGAVSVKLTERAGHESASTRPAAQLLGKLMPVGTPR